MKRMITAGILFFLVALQAAHACSDRQLQRYLTQHQEVKQSLVQTLLRTDDPDAFRGAMLDLGQVEMWLVVYNCLEHGDRRLVARHIGGEDKMRSRYDFPRFAYRLLLHEVNRSVGYKPKNEQALVGRRFTVQWQASDEE